MLLAKEILRRPRRRAARPELDWGARTRLHQARSLASRTGVSTPLPPMPGGRPMMNHRGVEHKALRNRGVGCWNHCAMARYFAEGSAPFPRHWSQPLFHGTRRPIVQSHGDLSNGELAPCSAASASGVPGQVCPQAWEWRQHRRSNGDRLLRLGRLIHLAAPAGEGSVSYDPPLGAGSKHFQRSCAQDPARDTQNLAGAAAESPKRALVRDRLCRSVLLRPRGGTRRLPCRPSRSGRPTGAAPRTTTISGPWTGPLSLGNCCVGTLNIAMPSQRFHSPSRTRAGGSCQT